MGVGGRSGKLFRSILKVQSGNLQKDFDQVSKPTLLVFSKQNLVKKLAAFVVPMQRMENGIKLCLVSEYLKISQQLKKVLTMLKQY